MIEVFQHKIGEKFSLVTDLPASILRIYRSSDAKYFNTVVKRFEDYNTTTASQYVMATSPLLGTGLNTLTIDFLPKTQNDLIFEFIDPQNLNIIGRERHLYGGYFDPTSSPLCVVYGTVINPSGKPMEGVRVDAFINRGGYFVDKHPIVGPETSAITDGLGYFEMPLLQGISVTVTISELGFKSSGFVPKISSLELTPYCFLSALTPANNQ
jgi:hypothetical protein